MHENLENDKIEKMTAPPSVLMVGAFPPPVHGMAAVNAAVHEQLVRVGGEPTVINIAAKTLERSLLVRLGRVWKVAYGLSRLLFSNSLRNSTLYMSVSGGFGQVYEIFFLALARFRRMRVYLHHHSFAYLDKSKWVTHILTFVAGSNCVHIVLSTGMAQRLQSQYSSACRVLAISNAVFFSNQQALSVVPRNSLKIIGFISNISVEKGIFEFLDLVAAYEAEGLTLQAKIAGPCQDKEIENILMQRISTLKTVEYIGPQYGDDKELFFNEIDVLIFPTCYANEAEPLTIYEAMQRAIPVIAYGRGSIPEMVNVKCGLVIKPAAPFSPAALEKIKQWLSCPNEYTEASISAVKSFAIALEINSQRWDELRRDILGNGDSIDTKIS